MIRITAVSSRGFWRCGVAHPATPTDHPDGRFTSEELARLRAEPMLSVQEIGDEAESQAQQPAGGDGETAPQGQERAERIGAALAKVMAGEKSEDFTKDGRPKVEAIEREAGFDVAAGERDEAWAAAQLTGSQ